MMRVRTVSVALLIVLAAGTIGHAATILTATLTNDQENPPAVPTTTTGAPRPASFGSANLVLNDLMTAMTYSVTIFNIDFTGSQTADINDNLLAAHIHASPTVTPTTNAGVVFGFFGMPFNDNNPNDVVVTPFTTGVGGMITGKWDELEGNNTTLTAQLTNILTGHSYINFHTEQFRGGEVRGAIQVVPEPSSVILLGIGVAVMGFARYRRRL